MFIRLVGIGFCALLAGACQDGAGNPAAPSRLTLATPPATEGVTGQTGTGAASLQGERGARPFNAKATWAATGIQWAGLPGQATSTFGGRCSVPSDYVISAAFEGQATHAGRVTGTTSHCSQIAWGPQGPMGATYSDGKGLFTTANGSTIMLHYGNGMTGVDPDTGLSWFRDEWTFTGGTGLFAGATGGGVEGGSFASFEAVLGGVPVPMWMEGTITYNPSGK
jgi:hypothetical protein